MTGTSPGTAEFLELIMVILRRTEEAAALIDTLEVDNDLKKAAHRSLMSISEAFSLKNSSLDFGDARKWLNGRKTAPLRALSPVARLKMFYPCLTEEEREQTVAQVDELIGWLRDHQMREHDFIRAALIEGLQKISFRLEKMEWFGYADTLRSLREVVSAYLALESADIDPVRNPDAEVVLRKTREVCVALYKRLELTKDVTETAGFGLKALGLVTLALGPYATTIAGLLN